MLISTQAWADKTYTVKKGDSLYKISKKFKTKVEAISEANNLESNKLSPGTELIIPSKEAKKVDAAEVAENSSPENTVPQQAVKAEPKTYKVKKGDTLLRIAKKFSVSVKELKTLNNLKSSRLKRGQVLLLEQQPAEIEADTSVHQDSTLTKNTKDAEKIKEIINAPEPQRSKLKEFLVFVAQQTLGIPYRFGSNTFKRTDCSGYVQNVFSLLGINLPRSAREQFHIGEAVDKKDLSMGDLVFFKTYASFPSHVGIYLGNNLFIHASTFGRKVTIDSLTMPYFVKRFIGAKRLPALNEANVDDLQQSLETTIQ